MQLIDTHCHIHEADYPKDSTQAYKAALEADVYKLICVGTDVASSQRAVSFAKGHESAWASLGVHPHEAKLNDTTELEKLITEPKVVAVGECGLDYYYHHSPRDVQIKAFRQQIELALAYHKPLIFHVREAFDDFWPIFDEYQGIRGVLHSFTDTAAHLEKALQRNLYIGVNGISTFTKVDDQITMFKRIPKEKLLLETDAPFLTPVPLRGTINEPAYVVCIAKYLSELYGISLKEIAEASTHNANELFTLTQTNSKPQTLA
ncbi:MAG TPA: TatD family hydrolase [Candidatus Saccharimonadales bacterium]